MKNLIYTAYHRAAPRIESTSVLPIQVGRAANSVELPNMLGDDTGENISAHNASWCELTALYWAWKNDRETDGLLGIMHYRRVPDLTDRSPTGPVEVDPNIFDVAEWCEEAEAWFEKCGPDYDLVIPREHKMGVSVEANYKSVHAPNDWEILRTLLNELHPEYVDSFEFVAKHNSVRLGNVALMRRPIFDRYCTWLFEILFAVDGSDVFRENYSSQQTRYLGYLAERLLTVFVHHLQKTEVNLRIKEVSILNLSEALVVPYIGPKDNLPKDSINLSLASDRNYLPHSAAMLRSVIDNLESSRQLNVFFLYSGIDSVDLDILDEMLSSRPNTVLHRLQVPGIFENSYRSKSRAPSNATYYRFLLFRLLPGASRVLFLDSDLIVNGDISHLFDSDLEGAQLGAVPDWIMTRTLTGPTKTFDANVPDLCAYQRNELGMIDGEIARYFNAGVLLFDFSAIENLEETSAELFRYVKERKFLFRDQDILNVAFKESYKSLDPRWNVFNSELEAYSRVPRTAFSKAMAARKDPLIVHFADRKNKPWNTLPVPLGELYWSNLIKTPFYPEVVRDLKKTSKKRKTKSNFVEFGRSFAERFPLLKTPMMKIYAWLRSR